MIDFIIHNEEKKRKAKKARKAIEKKLNALGIPYSIHVTKKKGHATELARELIRNGSDTIVAVGGDGTVHETLNGLENFEGITFGIIPAGTGNDFASTMGIPTKTSKALQIILDGNKGYVDFIECSGIRCMNALGTGIDVDILKHYDSKKIKNKLQYSLSLIHCLIHYNPYEITLVDKNGVKHAKKVLVASLCNGRCYGGGIKISPDSVPNDGTLELMIVNDLPRKKFLGALLKLASGKIQKICTSECIKTEGIKIEGEFPIQLDGEIYEGLPFDTKIVSNTLKMFVKR